MDSSKLIDFMNQFSEKRIIQIRKEVFVASIQEFFKMNDRQAVSMIITRLVGIGFVVNTSNSLGGKTIYTLDHSVIDKYLEDPLFFIK